MTTASIISIGNELLSGRTIDTNAAWLSTELLALDIQTASVYIIPDRIDPILRSLRLAAEDADVILITGGLGPTRDDITRDVLAKYLDSELRLRPDLLEQIRKYFADRNRPMAETNQIQAMLPAAATAMPNTRGTAPGIAARHNNKLIFAMPGVPHEMKKMFADSVAPRLRELTPNRAIVIKKLQVYGTGESNIAQTLGPLMDRDRNPLINSTASGGVITLHIIATAPEKDRARQLAARDESTLREKLGPVIFAEGDRTLAETTGRILARAGKTLTVAESCTGGLIAKLFTDAPGASDFFSQSWVTYSDHAKTAQLAVPPNLLHEHGAVSAPVARAMAAGARRNARADYAIAVTGIAGPTGATEQKPLGLVFIAVATPDDCTVSRNIFPQPRSAVRLRAALTAINMLRLQLNH